MAGDTWTFLTNHAHVLLVIHRDPDLRQRDIARLVGVTEGAVQRILGELEEGGHLRRERQGRRNRYAVVYDSPLRHSLDAGRTVRDLLAAVDPGASAPTDGNGHRGDDAVTAGRLGQRDGTGLAGRGDGHRGDGEDHGARRGSGTAPDAAMSDADAAPERTG